MNRETDRIDYTEPPYSTTTSLRKAKTKGLAAKL